MSVARFISRSKLSFRVSAACFAMLIATLAQPAAAAPIVQNKSFEQPVMINGFVGPQTLGPGYFAYTSPPDSFPFYLASIPDWTFPPLSPGVDGGGDGLVTIGGLGATPTAPPDGTVAAFIQGTGTISQVVAGFDVADTYTISFYAQARHTGVEPILVKLDSTTITFAASNMDGSVTPPSSTAFTLFTSNPFTTTTGSHTLSFTGTVPFSVDSAALSYIDLININVPEPASIGLVVCGVLLGLAPSPLQLNCVQLLDDAMKINRQTRAFTLVELLVVIGIIALLIAFLMPALRGAREQAKLVQDLSNIRQCAIISVGMYAADYGGAIPPLCGTRSGFPVFRTLVIIQGGSGAVININEITYPYNISWPDLIQMYAQPKMQRDNPNFLEYAPIMYCAADWAGMDGGSTPYPNRDGWWGDMQWREFSWRMNANVTPVRATGGAPSGEPIFGQKVSGVRRASQKILFAESHYEGVAGAVFSSPQANGLSQSLWLSPLLSRDVQPRYAPLNRYSPPRHANGFVVAYCDGSARIVNWAERVDLLQMKPADWDLRAQ